VYGKAVEEPDNEVGCAETEPAREVVRATLRTYTAFVLEADQRAAEALAMRRPRPVTRPAI
jgi:hypothetical protein